MIIQNIKLKSTLEYEELLLIAEERKSQFETLDGLIQKYYVKYDTPGEYGGVYIWDSRESLAAFGATELARSIPSAYKLVGPPAIEVVEVIFSLR